jgi:hypothetical protein
LRHHNSRDTSPTRRGIFSAYIFYSFLSGDCMYILYCCPAALPGTVLFFQTHTHILFSLRTSWRISFLSAFPLSQKNAERIKSGFISKRQKRKPVAREETNLGNDLNIYFREQLRSHFHIRSATAVGRKSFSPEARLRTSPEDIRRFDRCSLSLLRPCRCH